MNNDPNEFDLGMLNQMSQEELNALYAQYADTGPQPTKDGHVLEFWQDWISLLILVVTLLDYLRPSWHSVKFFWFKTVMGGEYPAVNAGPIIPTHSDDEETGLTREERKARARRRKHEAPEKIGKRQQRRRKRCRFPYCVSLAATYPRKKDKDPLANKVAPKGVNMYDIAKCWAVLAMICDHYGYFGIPGIEYNTARWTRVVGRTAAPLFFFLSGFGDNFRFRWRTWCWALFLFCANAWLRLRLTHTSWESLITILFINWALAYLPFYRIESWITHAVMFGALYYSRDYMSNTLRWAYGSLPYEIAIAGMLVRHKHPAAKFWCAAAMCHYCSISVNVFSTGTYMTCWIVGLLAMDTVVFMFFDRFLAVGEFRIFESLGIVKDIVRYISRQALLIYCVHLMLFRMIQLTKYSW